MVKNKNEVKNGSKRKSKSENTDNTKKRSLRNQRNVKTTLNFDVILGSDGYFFIEGPKFNF